MRNPLVLRSELDVRIEAFETIVSKFRLEQKAVVDALIMNDCIEEFNEVDEPVSKYVEEMYFKVKHIISRLSKKDAQSTTIAAPTLSVLPKIELPKFNGDILS
ncbi:Integrase catalytic domain-containing protein [Aphis craccivora]|uniref:Integrase catalytic domain-containing protein n=1 Tax=Aphis craccivora TaxID=307492 RepID=A0A6G0XRI0_APHCR|nr:Integrase catalytic domain-containing protein [Aphis craccivora]